MQLNLLDTDKVSPVERINGLRYIPDYITHTQEAELIAIMNQQPWLAELKRRVQHYGWKYDYKARCIDPSMNLGSLPHWLQDLCRQLVKDGLFKKSPDQVIINEYLPGQGVASHIDCVPCFGNTIASLSLNSNCVMDFTHEVAEEKTSALLEASSLLVLDGDARYKWKHGITARKTDKYQGQTLPRSRRISLTCRSIIID